MVIKLDVGIILQGRPQMLMHDLFAIDNLFVYFEIVSGCSSFVANEGLDTLSFHSGCALIYLEEELMGLWQIFNSVCQL